MDRQMVDCQSLRNVFWMFSWEQGMGQRFFPHLNLAPMLTPRMCPQDTDPQPAVSGHPKLGVPRQHAPAARGVLGHRWGLEHLAGYLRGQICGLPCNRLVFVLESLQTKLLGGSQSAALLMFQQQFNQIKEVICQSMEET